jgi:hypothetical protein
LTLPILPKRRGRVWEEDDRVREEMEELGEKYILIKK